MEKYGKFHGFLDNFLGILQIAMWKGNTAELAVLQKHLSTAIGNQQRLVLWRWLLSAVTHALDYAGAILNFVCVALPVAAGICLSFRFILLASHGPVFISPYFCVFAFYCCKKGAAFFQCRQPCRCIWGGRRHWQNSPADLKCLICHPVFDLQLH